MKKFLLAVIFLFASSLCFAQFTEVIDSYFLLLDKLDQEVEFSEASVQLQRDIDYLSNSKMYIVIRNQQPLLSNSIEEIQVALKNEDINGVSRGMKTYAYEILSIQNKALKNTNLFVIAFSAFLFITIFIVVLYISKVYHARKSKKIITEVYKSVDEERMRISRELHDTVAQELLGASLKIESMDTDSKEDINSLAVKIRETITEIRNVCYDLNPPAFLDDNDFEIALAELCHNFSKHTGINCQFFIDGENLFEGTDENTKLNIFRIVNEALQNIKKHAQAETATVNFRRNDTHGIAFFISDDGKGFNAQKVTSDLSKLQTGKHFGLNGIFQRAKILGGKAEVFSEPDDGCTIKITF